jgi:hypothetical protein
MKWPATLPADFVTAPDGSEIRLLLETARGGLSHCTLPPAGSLVPNHSGFHRLNQRIDLDSVGEPGRLICRH